MRAARVLAELVEEEVLLVLWLGFSLLCVEKVLDALALGNSYLIPCVSTQYCHVQLTLCTLYSSNASSYRFQGICDHIKLKAKFPQDPLALLNKPTTTTTTTTTISTYYEP